MQASPHNPDPRRSLPFPADLSSLLEPGSLESLTTLELGAVFRLLQAAWARGGELPASVSALATVARVKAERFEAMLPRLLWAMGCSLDIPNGQDCARCAHAVMALQRARARHESVRASKSAAGTAGAQARWGARPNQAAPPDGRPMARAMHLPSGAIPPALGPVSPGTVRARSAALERSQFINTSERSSAVTTDVIAAIHSGLEATVAARLTEWRASMSRQLLDAAAKRWLAEGRIKGRGGRQQGEIDAAFVIRIARHPFATPALVEIAIGRADEARAESALGYVAQALGTGRTGEPLVPYLHDQSVLDKWDRLEAAQVGAARAIEATRAIGVAGSVMPVSLSSEPIETSVAARRNELAALKQRRQA